MIRKIYLLWLAGFIVWLAACQTSELDGTPTDQPIEKATNLVTIEEAEKELLSILDDLAKQSTRSYDGNTTNLTISSRYSLGTYIQTRSADEEADPYVHIFNLGDEDGFAIMSGDDRTAPFLALTFQGSINPDTEIENPGLIMALAGLDQMLQFELNDRQLLIDDHGGGGGGSSNRVEYSAWSTTYYAMKNGHCPVEWGQGPPHNNYCFTNDGKVALTGCVPTAVAQLMACYKYPSSYGEYTFNWNDMTSNKKADGLYSESAKNQVARLMHQLGLSKNLNVTYGTTDSGAYRADVPKTLKNFGFSNGGILKDYDDNTVINELKNGYYTLLAGNSFKTVKKKKVLGITISKSTSYSGGHVWLAHGLMRRYRTKTTYNSSGKVLSTSIEEYYYPLCNLGWTGTGDGYYISGSFNTNNGPVYTRSEDEEDKSGKKYNYQYNIQAITGIRK
ncbi:MAG: C10 family peptidase [Bacteroides sp.]|nr:C10 family peptidase [Bacteroides sp.]